MSARIVTQTHKFLISRYIVTCKTFVTCEICLDKSDLSVPSGKGDDTIITTLNEITAEQKQNVCSICLAVYIEGDDIAYNDCDKYCRHLFHRKCIENWLMKSLNCPCCRRQFINLEKCMGQRSNDIEKAETSTSSSVSLLPVAL